MTSYEAFKYVLETYVTDDVIAETDANMIHFLNCRRIGLRNLRKLCEVGHYSEIKSRTSTY